MSLIHKALRKTEEKSSREGSARPEVPVEEFVGHKEGFLSPSISWRTIVLVFILVLAIVYLVYVKFLKGQRQVGEEEGVSAPIQTAVGAEETGKHPSDTGAETVEDLRRLEKEAMEMFKAGRIDDALGKFKQALNLSPNEPSLLNNIGLVYKKKGDFREAEKYYKRALEINPDYPECLNNMGALKAASKEPLEAAIYFKKAILLKPSYADPYFNLAVLMEEEGNYSSAVENYKLFLKNAADADNSLLNEVRERIEELTE